LAETKFDRIILLLCLHQLRGHESSFIEQLCQRLMKDGQLVIVHREAHISTLPLPKVVLAHWTATDEHSSRLIEQLHCDRRETRQINWEMEEICFTIDKSHWFNLLIDRSFYPLTLTNHEQVTVIDFKTNRMIRWFIDRRRVASNERNSF
jgi:hypothetical protein